MSKKCPSCNLVNFTRAEECARCGYSLAEVPDLDSRPRHSHWRSLLNRLMVFVVVCVCVLAGFYLSLIASATRLNYNQRKEVEKSITVLSEKGFSDEVFLLNYVTAFRADDNWLNASVAKENAYAATNYPFEIMTLYADFFTYPIDETERAAILLHEAKHLQGKSEKEAYEFVWKNRWKLGWTRDKYAASPVWQNVRKQTREIVPELFNCSEKPLGDCTE